jgi:hypothetical protein
MRLDKTPEEFDSIYWGVAEPKEVPRWATLEHADTLHIRQCQRQSEE